MQQHFSPDDTEPAYGKINLFLDVIRRREDGYHDIGTLFQTVDLSDTLHGKLRTDGRLTFSCDRPATDRPEQDLTFQAADALRNLALERGADKAALGADLLLIKRLPSGAGMGGGSADAAAALRLLNRLWNLRFSDETLRSVGTRLGADVPFLITGGTAFAEGIGEILSPAPPPSPGGALLIVTPHASVSTPEAYRSLTPSGSDRWTRFKQVWGKGVSDLPTLGTLLFNKFEESVTGGVPEIAALTAELRRTSPLGVLLSGSGASVFALYPTREEAENGRKSLRLPHRFSGIGRFL